MSISAEDQNCWYTTITTTDVFHLCYSSWIRSALPMECFPHGEYL